MKALSFLTLKGKTIRVREQEQELAVDADGRYFSLPLAEGEEVLSVCVGENLLILTTLADAYCYSLAGQKLFSLCELAGEALPPILNATLMNPFEALTFLARQKDAPLAKEHPHFYCVCEGGRTYLVDLAEGCIVYQK